MREPVRGFRAQRWYLERVDTRKPALRQALRLLRLYSCSNRSRRLLPTALRARISPRMASPTYNSARPI